MQSQFGLYLILTNPICGYAACAHAAVQCGVKFLQLRMKEEEIDYKVEIAQQIRTITRNTSTQFIINDDLELAIKVDADGIHLGQDDLTIQKARAQWNKPNKVYGLSTHNLQQAKDAEALGVDYIGVGPLFPTPTKCNAGPALGVERACQIIKRVSIPSVVIGGINQDNLPELLQAGAKNYCVVSAVNDANNPTKAIQTLQRFDAM